MTALDRILRREIAETGPLTVARYMELCLSHPEHGYYTGRDPLGAPGDFVTAPEISQMFGEMIGAWVASIWQGMGCPPFRLVELGPGRGTLMADMLRVLKAAGADRAAEIWLVETSPRLRAEQTRRVPGARHVAHLREVPEGPLILIANEFLDALPARQFLKSPEGWRERLVGLRDDQLAFGLSEPLPGRDAAPVAAWAEISPAADAVTAEIARRLGTTPGAALIIDYGYRKADRPPGFTLQAVRAHARADPLATPGEADLTWLIDFDALARALGTDGAAVRLSEQGALLARLGIGQRAEALARARPDRVDAIADALERLTAPDAMGTLFKAAAALSPGLAAPPGFDPGSGED